MIDSFIILPSRPGGDALLARRAGGQIETSRGDLVALSAHLNGSYAIILPGQQLRAFLTDVPERIKGADRINIARFAHENRVASNLDDLHIVVGSGDPAPTLMVARGDMDVALESFNPQRILADFDALSGLAGEDVQLLDRVVTPGPQGVSVDRDWADGPVTVLDDDTLVRSMFERLDSGDALDLRSGTYRRRAQIEAGPWVRLAAVGLVCGLLGLGLIWADARAIAAQADALRDQARTFYTQATGQVAPDNLSRLVRTANVSQVDSTAFLTLSDQLFAALSAHADITLERLSFEVQDNSLRLRLIYPDFEAASALERSVAEAGAVFITGGVREQRGRFIGDAAFSLGETS